MPRSSRHKSSKQSSREYSDSEKDTSVKERKSKDEANGELAEEYNWWSKRRKEDDRWNGGEHEEEEEEKEKETVDVVKKQKKKKHRDSIESDRDKNVTDHHIRASHKTDSNSHNLLQSPDGNNQHDRRIRRKRDGSGDGDGDRHHDNGDIMCRQLTSKADTVKDVRSKDDKHKDERLRDKNHEDLDRENRHREDKHRDERVRDRVHNRSEEKRTQDEKDTVEVKQKKSVPQDGDQDHDYHRDRDRDRGRERDRDRDHLHGRDRGRNLDLDHERDREREHERDKEREHERDRDRDRNNDYNRAYVDDRSARYKDCREKKRSPDDVDDVKHKSIRNSADNEKKSSGKIEPDVDRGRSQTHQSNVDNVSNSRRRLSPNSSSRGASDDYRSSKAEDSKYKDSPADQRPKTASLREMTAFSSERVSKYSSLEKPVKMDEGNMGELSVERYARSKASPKGLADRSPSSSLERRYMNRNSVRRSLEVEESGRRSRDSMGARDFPSAEDRLIREVSLDESLPSDASFYNRSSQSNSALIPPSSFRGGVGSPSSLAGSLEEDGRVHSGGRFKRSGDHMSGRGQGNAWRGAQNWSAHVPNGYIPFQHGPSHGGFQAMMPQFPSPHLFGLRPMDINQSGIPYHMPDADRFSGHLRPLGWQNMMDGSGPSHMHGWDGNNVVFRDEAHFYGGAEWDQNRHPMNGRGWESGADMWKGQNGDLPSTTHKEEATVHGPSDDDAIEWTGQMSQKENNNNGAEGKDIETKPASTSTNESSKNSCKTSNEKMVDPSASSDDGIINVSGAYLSKLDISEKLASPELFKQGIGLLSKKDKTPDGEDIVKLVNLKDDARVVAKGSTLWSSSLFPATNNSVFQRALNIYKKQRACVNGLPIVNSGMIDAILASNNIKDEVPADDMDKMESPKCYNVETADAIIPEIDEKTAEGASELDWKSEAAPKIDEKTAEAASEMVEKSEAAPKIDETAEVVPITVPNEKPGEIILVPGVDSDANVDTPNELQHEAYNHNSSIPVQDKVDGVLPEMQSLENPQDNTIANSHNISQSASDLPTTERDGDDSSEMKENDSSVSSEERKGRGDALSGSLVLKDGSSPKAYGSVVMSELNECESVCLNRIHHSPESTH